MRFPFTCPQFHHEPTVMQQTKVGSLVGIDRSKPVASAAYAKAIRDTTSREHPDRQRRHPVITRASFEHQTAGPRSLDVRVDCLRRPSFLSV